MAKVIVQSNDEGRYVCMLSDGRVLRPISPPYVYLTEAKIFRKAFELGRVNPEPLYSGFSIEYDK